MTAIAVTGVSGSVGQRLLPQLAALSTVERVVGLDVREPRRRARHLEFHRVDLAGAELKPLLEGVDVVVHLAAIVDPIPDGALMTRANVEATRHLLDAAAAVGVRKVIRVSPSWVYGAWSNNPVPITEDAPLRPNEGYLPPVHAAEVERLLAEWGSEHPGAVVTVLRSAPVLGGAAERLPARLVLGHPALRVRGAAPPVQVVHVDDLVDALVLAVGTDLPGAYNVAADGWLDAEAAGALLPRAWLPPLPAESLQRVLDGLWWSGLGDVPPGIVPYLVHPCVIAADRLRAAGWSPRHENEDAILDGLDALPKTRSRLAPIALGAVGVFFVALAGGAALSWRRRKKGSRRATRPIQG
ncbi:MAG: NAD-dependent epimerase/dehydratase family protein [Acidimicrobiia bacterium]